LPRGLRRLAVEANARLEEPDQDQALQLRLLCDGAGRQVPPGALEESSRRHDRIAIEKLAAPVATQTDLRGRALFQLPGRRDSGGQVELDRPLYRPLELRTASGREEEIDNRVGRRKRVRTQNGADTRVDDAFTAARARHAVDPAEEDTNPGEHGVHGLRRALEDRLDRARGLRTY